MPRKINWTVRIVLHRSANPNFALLDREFGNCGTATLVTEVLRYAGITKIIKDSETELAFDLYPPEGSGGQMWAEMNARRISSFGINAVAAKEVRS